MATIRQKAPHQWHVQIRRRGWPTQTRTFRTKKDAEFWARDIESGMDKGRFMDRSPADRTTLADLLRRYRADVSELRPGIESRKAECARIARLLRDESALCAHSIANLKPEHFEDYRDRRLKQFAGRGKPGGRGQYKAVPYKPALRKNGTLRANAAKPKAPQQAPRLIKPGTVKRELTLLKNVIKRYMKKLGIVINPVNHDDVKRPIVNDERDVRLAPSEIRKLLSACRDLKNIWIAPLVEFAFELGARRGNLLRLEWSDIDLKRRSVVLRAVKNSRSPEEVKDIVVGLSPRAVEILTALPRTDGPRVFPISADALKSAFNRARVKAGVEHFRFHDSRHERTSSLVEANWSDVQVMAQTGHRDPKSLKRYSNLRENFLADQLAQLPARAGAD
jgi:integrase